MEHEQKVAKFINSKIKYCGPIQSLQHRTTQSGGKKGNPNQAWETQHITVIKRWRNTGQVWKEVFSYEACLDKESIHFLLWQFDLISWRFYCEFLNFTCRWDTVRGAWSKHLSTKAGCSHLSRAETAKYPNPQGKLARVNENFKAYIGNTTTPLPQAPLWHREAGEKSKVRKRVGDDGKEKERDRRLHRFIRPVSPPPAS